MLSTQFWLSGFRISNSVLIVTNRNNGTRIKAQPHSNPIGHLRHCIGCAGGGVRASDMTQLSLLENIPALPSQRITPRREVIKRVFEKADKAFIDNYRG